MRSHEWVDQRSLALARAVADKLEANPQLLNTARENLTRWISASGDQPLPAHLEWRDLLNRLSVIEVRQLLRSDTEEARRLRQSNPFAGALTPQERWLILREYEARAT